MKPALEKKSTVELAASPPSMPAPNLDPEPAAETVTAPRRRRRPRRT